MSTRKMNTQYIGITMKTDRKGINHENNKTCYYYVYIIHRIVIVVTHDTHLAQKCDREITIDKYMRD